MHISRILEKIATPCSEIACINEICTKCLKITEFGRITRNRTKCRKITEFARNVAKSPNLHGIARNRTKCRKITEFARNRTESYEMSQTHEFARNVAKSPNLHEFARNRTKCRKQHEMSQTHEIARKTRNVFKSPKSHENTKCRKRTKSHEKHEMSQNHRNRTKTRNVAKSPNSDETLRITATLYRLGLQRICTKCRNIGHMTILHFLFYLLQTNPARTHSRCTPFYTSVFQHGVLSAETPESGKSCLFRLETSHCKHGQQSHTC